MPADKQQWHSPRLAAFRDWGEVWAHYHAKATPEELAALKKMMAKRWSTPPDYKRELRRRA